MSLTIDMAIQPIEKLPVEFTDNLIPEALVTNPLTTESRQLDGKYQMDPRPLNKHPLAIDTIVASESAQKSKGLGIGNGEEGVQSFDPGHFNLGKLDLATRKRMITTADGVEIGMTHRNGIVLDGSTWFELTVDVSIQGKEIPAGSHIVLNDVKATVEEVELTGRDRELITKSQLTPDVLILSKREKRLMKAGKLKPEDLPKYTDEDLDLMVENSLSPEDFASLTAVSGELTSIILATDSDIPGNSIIFDVPELTSEGLPVLKGWFLRFKDDKIIGFKLGADRVINGVECKAGQNIEIGEDGIPYEKVERSRMFSY